MTTDRQTTYRAVVGLPKSRPNGRPKNDKQKTKWEWSRVLRKTRPTKVY